MSGAATAALAELVGQGDARRAALWATLAQSGGSALGVIVSGALAQWAPAQDVLPFVVGMAACAAAAAALWTVPETARREGGLQIRRPRVPKQIRRDFVRIGITVAAVWAVAAGLFLSVIPSFTGMLVLHSQNLAVLGLMAALVLACSCIAQVVVRRGSPPAPTQAGGLVLLAIGLIALIISAVAESLTLLVTGAVLAGFGHGLAFLAAQDNLTRIAPQEQRAEVSAAFYVCIYLGVALPVIGIGVLAVLTTLFIAVTTFAVVTGLAALAVAGWHLTSERPRSTATS